MPIDSSAIGVPSESFAGFESLDANYIYCPNQFFDLCLPHYRRGVVRLVAFMLVETLRWRDENGNPVNEEIVVRYIDLVKRAGISRGQIDGVIAEAIQARFIECVIPARQKSKGQGAQSAQYKLCWSRGTKYHTELELFDGFHSGDGHCSPVPLAFFTFIVPNEPLADIRFVGTVLRHTVGFANKYGRRRPKAPLSFDTIKQYANYADRQQAVKAARRCISKGYVCRIEQGAFDPDGTVRKPSTYAPKWLEKANNTIDGSKKTPAPNGSQLTPDKRFKKDLSNGSKTTPGKQFKKDPTRKIVNKQTYKQQGNVVVLLQQEGFSQTSAEVIARGRTLGEVQQQITWLQFRDQDLNRLGVLRRSIEEGWSEPTELIAQRKEKEARGDSRGVQEVSAKSKSDGDNLAQERDIKRQRREELRTLWHETSEQIQRQAVLDLWQRTDDPIKKAKIERFDLDNPPFLLQVALEDYLSTQALAA